MLSPRAFILRAPGTNCDQETAYAFERAGGHTKRIHVQALAQSPPLLDDCRIFGLMPHPERFIDATQHPAWAGRLDPHADGAGLTFFRNALRVVGKDLG